ncbi:hypothetical protein [Fontivita pretiosa]|uniref:hypothetical protein n=1 Tax=Fontivita pretiosa TaxID=2989684 RepID=UPI003D16C26B
MIILAGSVRPAGLLAAVKRPVLQLPLSQHTTVLQQWIHRAAEFRRRHPHVPVRLLLDSNSPQHNQNDAMMPPNCGPSLILERDPKPYRGTGGLLRDLAEACDFRGWFLVLNAAQRLSVPLERIHTHLSGVAGEVRLATDEAGVVDGAMLVNCDVLRKVPCIGYCDFKEQVLATLSQQGYSVGVARMPRHCGLPIRSREQYLRAVAAEQACRAMDPESPPDPTEHNGDDASGEPWRARFALIEKGACIDPSAIVHDSVILAGAKVARRSAVIRSVVCPGAAVSTGTIVQDALVS